MLVKASCSLRPVVEADSDVLFAWRNSERVRSMMFSDHAIAPEEHAAWFRRVIRDGGTDLCIFAYEGRPLGLSNASIDRTDGRCAWGYYIGEADAPKGSGTAMACFALDRFFDAFALRKVVSEVFDFNEPSARMLQRLGFAQEGRSVAHRRKGEAFADVFTYAIFASQWAEHRLAAHRTVFGEGSTA